MELVIPLNTRMTLVKRDNTWHPASNGYYVPLNVTVNVVWRVG